MRDVRRVMCWIFAVTCLLNLTVFFRSVLYGIRYYYPPPLLRSLYITGLVSAAVSLCSGVAWWTLWRKKRHARIWAIAASAMSVVIFVRQFVFPTRPVWDHHWGALFIGIVGLVVFSWPDKQDGSNRNQIEPADSRSGVPGP